MSLKNFGFKDIISTGCGKKYPPQIFCSFFSNCLEFQSEILPPF